MRRLAERFWNLAKGFESESGDSPEPVAVVRHVLKILDAFDRGAGTTEVSVSTQSFLVLLRQHELEGDLLYAAPEQVRGEMMDERSLVFSVGVLLFEKLTGRHPFGAEGNPNRVARMQKGQIGSGVNFFPVIPPGLRTVLMKAMGPFPEERWSSLAEMRAELEAFVAESTGERPRREERQPKVVTILPAQSRRAGDEEQTRVVRRDPQPSLPPVAGARASSTSEMVPARQSPAWLPALWAFAGAAVTAILFLVLRPGAPPPAAPAPARDTPPVTIVVPAVEPVVAPAPVATPAPVGAPAPAPAPTPTPVPPPSGAFDPEDIGRRAASVLESCFTPARLGQPGGISMGATLIFNPKSATAAKIYFAAGDGLSVAEHRCAKAELMGVAAGSPPAAGTVVEYGFRLKPGKADVRHKLVK